MVLINVQLIELIIDMMNYSQWWLQYKDFKKGSESPGPLVHVQPHRTWIQIFISFHFEQLFPKDMIPDYYLLMFDNKKDIFHLVS